MMINITMNLLYNRSITFLAVVQMDSMCADHERSDGEDSYVLEAWSAIQKKLSMIDKFPFT